MVEHRSSKAAISESGAVEVLVPAKQDVRQSRLPHTCRALERRIPRRRCYSFPQLAFDILRRALDQLANTAVPLCLVYGINLIVSFFGRFHLSFWKCRDPVVAKIKQMINTIMELNMI